MDGGCVEERIVWRWQMGEFNELGEGEAHNADGCVHERTRLQGRQEWNLE